MQTTDSMTNSKINAEKFARLSWACRRGMLELDVLLGNFLREAYSGLTEAEQQAFNHLLTHQDPELFAWLMGHEQPPDLSLRHLVDRIRLHARSRFSN